MFIYFPFLRSLFPPMALGCWLVFFHVKLHDSLSISCSLVLSSLSFCLLQNVLISPSFLKNIFAWKKDSQLTVFTFSFLFFFYVLILLAHCLLASEVSDERFYHCHWNCFSSLDKVLFLSCCCQDSLSLGFRLIMICLGTDFFAYFLFGGLCSFLNE